ncbi:organomercurial lyase [Agromyces silvae]|uniref:organomercurial lyase n=1 Tax=Agromyces silvae TaxID=3388266 RepID=UPI00280A850D|nr:organomercurial lyase [Agromyces protaetiae]
MTSDLGELVRLHIYSTLAATGLMPSVRDLATRTGVSSEAVDAALDELAAARHLVLDADRGVVLAHPFATRNFAFSVMGEHTLWWGGCAWDAFAIPNLVPAEPAALVATTCPACGTAHSWTVTREGPPDGTQVAHFLVPMARVWDDVVHACEHQRIFCDDACVARWLSDTGNERGAVFDLTTLWRLAANWYAGRLDSPYRRREPAEAAAYFEHAGLVGTFWGNAP